ncbi:DUF6344 domain-containing protein [Streptomyces sp. CB03234]|uniref:DUF6344 domain-containing protein n=1 Tax=Streptomyces sp. (strain CB03234) TaxID=1703937 RepID=UPI00093AFA72|nr:DUF6344 domain-containing protein [Streptomyces sp. CB03234]
MAAVKRTHEVTHFWTAFFSLLSAILTALGLKRTPSAAIPVYADQAPATATATATAAAPAPAPRCSGPAVGDWTRDLSLPPTIKQRIRAEAHGTSPSVRHLPAVVVPARTQPGLADATDVTDQAHQAEEAERFDRFDRSDLALAA